MTYIDQGSSTDVVAIKQDESSAIMKLHASKDALGDPYAILLNAN